MRHTVCSWGHPAALKYMFSDLELTHLAVMNRKTELLSHLTADFITFSRNIGRSGVPHDSRRLLQGLASKLHSQLSLVAHDKGSVGSRLLLIIQALDHPEEFVVPRSEDGQVVTYKASSILHGNESLKISEDEIIKLSTADTLEREALQ
jgi:hypothetical protein